MYVLNKKIQFMAILYKLNYYGLVRCKCRLTSNVQVWKWLLMTQYTATTRHLYLLKKFLCWKILLKGTFFNPFVKLRSSIMNQFGSIMQYAPLFSSIGSMASSGVANRTLQHLDGKSSRKSGTLMMMMLIISDCYCDDGEFRSTGTIKTVKDA